MTINEFYNTCKKYYRFNYNATDREKVIWHFAENNNVRLIFVPENCNDTLGVMLGREVSISGVLTFQDYLINESLSFEVEKNTTVDELNTILVGAIRDLKIKSMMK